MQHINNGLNQLCGRKLTFGDTEQIAIYKKMNNEAAEREERDRKREAGEFKKYRVHIELDGSYYIEVEAVDEEDAKGQAIEDEIKYDNLKVNAYRVDLIEKKRTKV